MTPPPRHTGPEAPGTAPSTPGSPLVHRGPELDLLEQMLAGSGIVTLVGPGGIGKTRLAEQALARTRAAAEGGRSGPEAHPRRIHRCDVAPCVQARDVAEALAAGLEVRGPGPGEALDACAARLASALEAQGPTLLMLDQLEHLTAELGPWLQTLAQQAPRATLLATSMRPLHVRGEQCMELGPLAVPSEGHTEAPALELFLQCVRSVRPAYDPAGRERQAAASIVRTLDGVPLALERMAPRLRTMAAEELAERAEEVLRWELQQEGELASTLTRAWNLLSPTERDVLARCSVFQGTFDLQAAEAVLDEPSTTTPLLDTLHALRDKSLLHGAVDAEGKMGLRQLAPLRLQAQEQLQRHFTQQTIEGLHERHAQHVASRAAALERSDARAALRWACEPKETDRSQHIGPSIVAFLRRPGPLANEDLDLAEHGLERLREQGDPASRAPALIAIGLAHRTAGNPARAAELLRDALEDASGPLPAELELDALEGYGRALGQSWAVQESAEVFEQAAERSRALGNRQRQARMIFAQTGALANMGRIDEATPLLEEALHLARTLGDPGLLGDIQARLGTVAIQSGRIAQARLHLERALRQYGPDATHRSALVVSGYLGLTQLWQGELDGAERQLDRVIETARHVGFDAAAAIFLAVLAVVAARRGAPDTATEHLSHAFAISEQDPVWRSVVDLYGCLVDLAEANDSPGAGEGEPSQTAWLGVLRRLSETRRRRIGEGSPEGRGPLLAEVSDDVRIALALVEQTLGASGSHSQRDADAQGSQLPVLTVRYGGASFALDGAEPVSIAQRPVLSRLLWALCTHQLRRPEQPMTTDELVAATWPGERLRGRSGANRLYVAVAELRKLGLKDVIVRDRQGYRLRAELRPAVDTG